MCDALFHSESHKVSLVGLLADLVQFADVHRVENWLDELYLPGRNHVHTLLDSHADILVFSGIDAIYTETITVGVILETGNFERAIYNLFLDFG